MLSCAKTASRKIQKKTDSNTYTVSLIWKKHNGRVPIQEQYSQMINKGVPDKYISLVKGVYHQCETVVMCAAGIREPFAYTKDPLSAISCFPL